ncbi:efflux RND transporter permease subunit [Psychrobium sp. 1_MG-2023]|uniref:efflux RND transporter permease subunit n=1 Tax=Psychrobium sp. 1_MG-2023 TaxID=3062624 RepID=UPI000C34258B|nr:efflux RND transporter permease subunit [Psychrobium sp. 1_MG-2023]MDP2562255.1 efflux RND transporter permease subunit [Psychrobium sp. 1_MG-2023]PKF57505.1 MFS transporter [Alteromonadales bacterium alter-6D02]
MDIAKLSISHRVISWMFATILLLGGIVSYNELGRLEDPEFTIKEAMILTSYPGASPMQVEEEVSYPIENALQQLPYIKNVKSISSPGLSQIIVEMQSTYRKDELRQIWDEVRRKVNDLAGSFPQGVNPPKVKDDFGDVFGVLLAITGDGYSYEELKSYADQLRRELVLIDGIGKVDLAGQQREQVVVEISRSKLVALGIPQVSIFELLRSQNTVSNAGQIKVGEESIRFHSTGEFKHVSELESLIISAPGSNELIYLGDVATVRRDYAEIPSNIITYNQQQALLIGVSFSSGVNVVKVGEVLAQRLSELEYFKPLGLEINTVYNQPIEVEQSVSSFILSLVEAVAIVIIVLLVFMGVRSGLLIGFILLITVFGTFIFMESMAIELQRISLGALIIALGMLVDNAIVVTEGILIGMKKGRSKTQAASDIVKQTIWPLLGATVIAITAFAPIGLSADATGEFAGSLFWVLCISLLLSWVTAITLTPFFASVLFKDKLTQESSEQNEDPYQGALFTIYRKVLTCCLRFRWVSITSLMLLLVLAAIGFGQVKQSFFPASNTPMFYVDMWRYQGSDIRATQQDIEKVHHYLLAQEGVEHVTSTVGQGAIRFMLTYGPEKSYQSYGQLIVRVTNRERQAEVMQQLRDYLKEQFPDSLAKIKPMEIGPAVESKLEARFSGADPEVLRQLAGEAKAILFANPLAFNVRDDWRQRSKVIRPIFNEAMGRRVGISKADLDELLLVSFSGKAVGLYRDGTHMLPIVARAPASERLSVDSLNALQIYSRTLKRYIPVSQVVDGFETTWEDSLILRRDRKRTITVKADHDVLGEGTADQLFRQVKPLIEQIKLPPGYQLSWGGEYESARDAQKALISGLPMGYLIMFMITVFLFNSLKAPLVIWATVPMAIIGVSGGLLVMGAAFSFMALLGLLSLSGMLIKNGIVLVDQINIELKEGKQPYDAIVSAGVSRVRPVAMAAITTILGMIPLLFDVFFQSMAVTIMFGLGFATILTLVFVPVFYATFYGIRK